MSRIAQPGVNPNAIQQAVNQVHQANTPVRESRQTRNEPQKQGGNSGSSSSSAETKSALGTSAKLTARYGDVWLDGSGAVGIDECACIVPGLMIK